MATLTLQNLFKRYENGKKGPVNDFAVNDFSLECNEGEFVGILGPSGCGKSTTLRMIAGLEQVTDGFIKIGDRVINDVLPRDRHIGLAFEDYALYPPLSVYDNIAFNLKAKKVPAAQIDAEIRRIAPLLKVDDLLDRKPAGLSGGQKQRVNIARAIVRKPKLLLLDEPLSHLDGKMRQILRTEIKRLHSEIKCTTIIVTHDQLEAMSLADRIAIMKDGRLQQFGTPLEIYNHPVNVFVAGFIGEPPMNLNRVQIGTVGGKMFFLFPGSEVKIEVPPKYRSILKVGQEVTLGIRPTDLVICTEKDRGSEARVAVFENFGEERRISFRIGDEFLTLITTNEQRYRQGDIVRLETVEEHTHIFDVTTGDRVQGT